MLLTKAPPGDKKHFATGRNDASWCIPHLRAVQLSDEAYMRKALNWAEKARERGEVPVGALLVDSSGEILSYGYNLRETWQTPLAHAEIIALQKAAKKLGRWRLLETTLYVTLEPCVMCAGALVQARVGRIVYGATDPKAGATDSLYRLCDDPRLNHRIPVTRGVLEAECSTILTDFFRTRRAEKRALKKT